MFGRYDPFLDEFSDDDRFLDAFPLDYGGKPLDMVTLTREAANLRVRRAIEAIGARDVPRRLLLEAELHLFSRRYRDALLCSLGFQQYLDDQCVVGQLVEEKERSLRFQAQAIEAICAYQLDDKNHATALIAMIEPTADFSEFLHDRVTGTAEILTLMPQLLESLEQEKRHSN